MAALPVTDATWNDEVLGSDLPVLVEVTATWCASGDISARAVDHLVGEVRRRLKVVRLDLDANPLTIRRYAITSIPTLLVIDQGRVTRRLVGGCNLRRLREDVADYIDGAGVDLPGEAP